MKKKKSNNWKWAQSSEQAKKVKQLEADFVATVNATKKIAILKKEQLKLKKTMKTFSQLDVCKEHWGPVSPNSLQLLDTLDSQPATCG